MLPKIVVAGTYEKKDLISFLGLLPSLTMEYEGNGGKVQDLRRFINFGVHVSSDSSGLSLLIWNAEKLSNECQAVLLKPLEESGEKVSMYLVVSNENGLQSTILSRCLVLDLTRDKRVDIGRWKEVLSCFSKGPAKCLDLADSLERVEMEETLQEVIVKLKTGLSSEINKNRLKILKMAIDCFSEISFTNVNAKLAFGNFLIGSWRLIKLDS